MEKRCVITGLGLICAAGNDVDTCWQNICAGKTGIDEVKSVSTEGCVSHVGAEVHCEDLPAPEYDRSVRLCLHAAHEAVRDGRLTDSAVREAGVILGSCVGGAASIDHYYTGLLQGRTEEQDVLKMSASAIAANTAFALGANGETANIVNACAAGTMSVSYACDLIRLGRGEIFLAGGTDAFSSLAYAGFNALHALSAGPCSPLNHSNGISLGEGAGILVVEEYEHAVRRGAKIYCEVAGWGVSSDAFHITAPQPQGEGQMAALHRAMVNAGTEAGDIGYINAHGTGTAKNDAAEFLSLHTLFEGAAPSVSSTKSMTGHCLGAAGAIEAVLSVKALTENTVLPTTGYAPEDLAPLAEKAGNLDCVVNVAHDILPIDHKRAAVGLGSAQGGMKHRAILGRVHMLASKHRIATLLNVHGTSQIEQQPKRLLVDEVLGEVEMQLAHIVRELGNTIGIVGKCLLQREIRSNLFLVVDKRRPLRGLRCIDRSRNNRHKILLLRAGLRPYHKTDVAALARNKTMPSF